MVEQAAPLEIKDREGLEGWLRTQPREVAVIIAARAALRVLPQYSGFARRAQGQREFAERTLPLFRATAIARFVGKYATHASPSYSL
jgi:hypothetical protein